MGRYVTLASVRAALGEQNQDRDDLISDAIDEAEAMIDNECGRTFDLAAAAVARVFAPVGRRVEIDDGELLLVDDIGSASGLVVETGRGTTWSATTDYELWPTTALATGRAATALLRPFGTWPIAADRVRVTARWGWPAVPAPIRGAARLQATRLYRRKDSPEGVVGTADFGQIRVSRTDPDVHAQIAPYILSGA